MAIPNPQSKIVDNTGKQNITLGELLQVQMDVEKWSQNTDVNTLRGQVESQKGFAKLKDSLGKDGAIATSVDNLTKGVKKPDKGAGIEGPVGELDDVFSRMFRVIAKNLDGFTENLNGVAFKEIGEGFLSTTRAAERVNSGFKELTNGIGQFGPMINTAKTFVFKLVAGFNVLLGVTQLISSAFVKFFTFLGGITGLSEKIGNFFGTIFSKDQGDRDSFIDNDQGVKDAIQNKENLLAEGPGQIKVTFIEGTANYYRDIATAFRKKTPIGVGGKATEAQNKLNEEFNKKKETAEEALTTAREKAGEKFDINQGKFKKKELLKQKAFEKKQILKQFAFQKAQQMKMFLFRMLKIFAPLLLLIGGIALAVDIFKNRIKEFADYPIAGIFTGLKTGLTKAGAEARNMFSGLKNFLGKLFPKMFPKTATAPKPAPKPKPGTTPKTPPKLDPKKAVTSVLKEGSDDVAKEASKTGAKEVAKTVGKQVVKKIPIIGAVAETAMDAGSNESKFAKIKTAYENQVPIMPDGNGDLRPMTEEEFLAAEQSMSANRAGSVGRGGGALAGATAGAAAGAAIGSVIPIVGTAIGGILGGVIGGFFGGRAGDKVATELANNAEGIDDPQAYIDMLANNVPELQNEAGQNLEAANGEVADATIDAQGSGGGGTAIAQNVNNNTNNESVNIMNQSVEDKQLEYAIT